MRHPAWRPSRPLRAGAACAAAFVAIFATMQLALAVFFSTSESVGGNTLATSTMAAPTGLAAAGSANIVLTWTATTTTYATGYNVLRSSTAGGPYSQITQVTPRTTVTYTDSPAAGTYYYVLQSYFQNWVSANSTEATAGLSNTGYLPCTANAADAGGDANGYETLPANACANDSVFAQDATSGTGTGTSCTGSGKDKHRFYNYGFSIPASSLINGIEVRLDALKSGIGTAPKLCVQLSWDAGTTWTTAKNTTTITGSEVTYTLGTAVDNWGRTWASTEFSNTNFRLRVIDVDNTTTQTFQLDYVAVQVTYTPP